jgi:hypothetical protein
MHYYQPFTYKAAAVFLGVGAGLLLYFQSEKSKVNKQRMYYNIFLKFTQHTLETKTDIFCYCSG